MRATVVLLATLAALDAAAFGLGLPVPVTVAEFHNRHLDHYFLTADVEEMAAIDAGSAGPGWERTGHGFVAFSPRECWHCPPAVERFYGTPGLGPNSHFYTADAGEAAALRLTGSGWTYEKTAFYADRPNALGGCAAWQVPVYRLYNRRWAQNDSNHRYVTSQRVREEMVTRGWADEGVGFCASSVADLPYRSFDVDVDLSSRILPSAHCEDESLRVGSCLAVNNLQVPNLRAGPYPLALSGLFADVTGAHSADVYFPGGADGWNAESVARGIFVNGSGSWLGIHIDTHGRPASSLASINPLYQMRTTNGPAGDERFFPFAASDLPAEPELSIRFTIHVRRVEVHDESSHAYGHPTVEFIDTRSGEHLYFTVLAYGRPSATDYLAPDVGSGKVIVGTEFRASTPYGRSVGASTLSTPPGFVGLAHGTFDFRMGRGDFRRVLDSARTINSRLSENPGDYIVDNFHFNNEVVGNARIGVSLGNLSLRLAAPR